MPKLLPPPVPAAWLSFDDGSPDRVPAVPAAWLSSGADLSPLDLGQAATEGSGSSRESSKSAPSPGWDLNAPAFEPDKMWTAADLAKAGLDLRQLCVEYAAVGVCPRGRACSWVHCRLDTSK